MAANRQIPTTGAPTGQQFADDANDEVVALYKGITQYVTGLSGADTITGNVTPVLTSYVQGMRFVFTAVSTNTGAVTLNISGQGAISVLEADGSALAAGRLIAGTIYEVVYDGTAFRVPALIQTVNSTFQVALFRYFQPDGTAGGQAVGPAIQIYPLNNQVFNGIPGCTLVGNQITLPPGEYEIEAAARLPNASQLLLRNVTAGSYSTTAVATQGGSVRDLHTPLHAILSLTATTTFELHYHTAATVNNDGLGLVNNFLTRDEEYGYMAVRRLSPFAASLTSAAKFGVNTAADDTIKLIARSDETKFEALPVGDGGTGDRIHSELAENGGGLVYKVIEEQLTLSGATEDGTKTIPDDAIIVGFSMRITTTVTGCTTITAGTDAAASEFGTGIALTAGTTFKSMLNDGLRTSSDVVRFTAVGGGASFSAGVVRYAVAYLEMAIPSG